MGHRVGTMACHPSDSGIHIDIERGESTPLLKKHYDYKPTIGKQAWDPKCVILSCFLIVGSFIGLYLLFEQEQKLKFNVPFFMVERSVLNFASPTSLLLRSGQAATPMENASGVIILNTRFPQCFTKQMCTEIIKSLISLGVPVQQNFLIGGDGHVYEVLGWDHPSKLEEFIQKRSMITVGFMGDFSGQTPPKLMFDVAKALISESIRRHRLNSDYNVFGMRNNSVVDGEAMYQHLAEWPRWKNVIDLKN